MKGRRLTSLSVSIRTIERCLYILDYRTSLDGSPSRPRGNKALEEALGQRTGEQLTAEFHQAASAEEHLRQQG
jgi:hypothetical protein